MQEYINTYRAELIRHVEAINPEQVMQLVAALVAAWQQDKQVFVLGNGGSAATANHFACDFGKNAVQAGKRRFRMLSLSSNVEAITALGNDIGFDEIFSQQLMNLLNPGDVVLAISASGNSPDVIKAVNYAKERGATVLALAGFEGGKLKELSDVCLVARMDSYERIEDIHLIILHMVTCYVKDHQHLL